MYFCQPSEKFIIISFLNLQPEIREIPKREQFPTSLLMSPPSGQQSLSQPNEPQESTPRADRTKKITLDLYRQREEIFDVDKEKKILIEEQKIYVPQHYDVGWCAL
eukprot:TRINITY_DN24878_c1_g2_i1.p2 TRINITY_DN24878_c1_g2~~TRINITY_DN24878_c1_g2_i1.p2  ORF type:complete len:106 (-),score=5.43 TRINITY_DN24878_c1_g2_i1:25-342(-)